MDSKKMRIESISIIKGKIALGLIINVSDENINQEILKDLKLNYKNKNIIIETSDGEIETKIIESDTYQSNFNFNQVNLFFQTDLKSKDGIKIGDQIKVIN